MVDVKMKGLFEEQDSLVCCPLRRSGDTYSFLHKSLQECFAALHMADQICEWQSGKLSLAGLGIGEKFLTDDVAVLKFLAQLVDKRVWAYRRQGQAATDAAAGPRAVGPGLRVAAPATAAGASGRGEAVRGR